MREAMLEEGAERLEVQVASRERRLPLRLIGIVGGVALVVSALFLVASGGDSSSPAKFLDKNPAMVSLIKAVYGPYGGNAQRNKHRPCGTPVKFIFDKIVHNNFGGVGPDSGDRVMRLEATKHDPYLKCAGGVHACDEKLILELRPTSEYSGTLHNHNGLNGTMATIGLDTGKYVDVEFVVKDPKTGKVVSPDVFPITWFDIDSDPDGTGQEYVVPQGEFFPFLEEGSKVDFSVSPGIKGDSVMYIAHPGASLAANPSDPYHLTTEQLQRVVAFEYRQPDKVKMRVGSMHGTGIRLFSFSMLSVLKPCPYKPPQIHWDWKILAAIAALLALLCCLLCFLYEKCFQKWRYRYRLMDVPVPSAESDRKSYAKSALKSSFDAKDSWRYRCALELALDAKVPGSEIPLVFQLSKHKDSFNQLASGKATNVDVQLCFVLDYTGSMGTQIKQVINCVTNISEEVRKMKIPHMPNAKVNLKMSAVGYNDFDDKSRDLGVPVITVFKGRQLKDSHSAKLTPSSFNLGGDFTSDSKEIHKFVDQKLGHGGNVPEELTGALIAASHLPWSAEFRLCIVITDAPCHGKDYHATTEDAFVDGVTGLSASGRPEAPLKSLGEKQVEVSILHTGSGMDKMLASFKKTLPGLKEQKVAPADTAEYIKKHLIELLELKPLSFDLRTFGLEDLPANMVPAPNESIQLKGSESPETKQYKSDREGLVWVGQPKRDFHGVPKAVIARPDAGSVMDQHWQPTSLPADLITEFKEGFHVKCDIPARSRK